MNTQNIKQKLIDQFKKRFEVVTRREALDGSEVSNLWVTMETVYNKSFAFFKESLDTIESEVVANARKEVIEEINNIPKRVLHTVGGYSNIEWVKFNDLQKVLDQLSEGKKEE
jgi:hypothetical protein